MVRILSSSFISTKSTSKLDENELEQGERNLFNANSEKRIANGFNEK